MLIGLSFIDIKCDIIQTLWEAVRFLIHATYMPCFHGEYGSKRQVMAEIRKL
jgi:hypothetical protein